MQQGFRQDGTIDLEKGTHDDMTKECAYAINKQEQMLL